MLQLLRTENIYFNCSEILKNDLSNHGDIEQLKSYFAEYIIVIMSAEIQQSIYKILEHRLSTSQADPAIVNFAKNTGIKVLRSVGKSEVSSFLGHFSQAAKENISNELTEQEITLYGNALSNRHNVAHSTGSNISFEEIRQVIDCANKFLVAVHNSAHLQ